MVVSNLIAGFRPVAIAMAALLTMAGAQPVLANSSATADIAAPLRAALGAKPSALGHADEEFRQLFANWQSLDKPQTQALVPSRAAAAPMRAMGGVSRAVAIPSRMPVEGVRLTSNFGMREHPILGGRRAHKGVDLAAPTGTPVYATADGTVGKAEWFSGYGLYIALEHGGNMETRYGHMSRLNVAAGQQVRKGDVIGFVGSTGRSTGPHLHYEVRVAGEAVNPMPYMQGNVVQVASAGTTAIGGPEE